MSRLLHRCALLAAAALAAAPSPARAAPDADADAAFTRGQRLEEALGDLEGAASAYRAASVTGDPARRAASLLREAAVLRALGRTEEARASLQAVLDEVPLAGVPGAAAEARRALGSLGEPAPPAASPELEALRERMRSYELELQRLRRELSDALRTTSEVEPLRESLAAKERELEESRKALRDAERAARGAVGELSEREIEERRREDAVNRRMLSLEWTRYGRDFYLAGRFEDARRFLRDALDLDPDNVAARDLLAKASSPSGDRERIVRGILEILAMEQEVAADQARTEAGGLAAEGERLLADGDAAGALEKADAALARIVARPDLLDRLEGLRERAAAVFAEAARRTGSSRRPPEAPAAPAEDPRWQEAVRSVLERAGSAGEAGGASLRILSLGPVMAAWRGSLPPSPEGGTRPRGFVLSGDAPPAGPLVRAAFRGAVEPAAWRAPGAVLEGVGATLVARAGSRALDAAEKAVASLASPPSRSLLVRATAFRCAPGRLVELLAAEGGTLVPLPGGSGAMAVLDPAAATALAKGLGGADAAPADAAFRVPERRGFLLAALRPRGGGSPDDEAPGLRIQGLGWFLPDGGVAAGVLVATAVSGPAGAAEILGTPGISRQEAAAGAALLPGGGLLLAGLADPLGAEPAHLAVLLVFGAGSGAGADPAPREGGTVLPLGDLPGRAPDVRGPLSGPAAGDARAARAAVLREWLDRHGPSGAAVLLEGNGVRVAGPAAAAGLVAADLERLRGAAAGPAVSVRAYAVDARTEAAALRGLPLSDAGAGSFFRYARLAGEERRQRLFLLEGSGTRIPLGEGSVALLPAARLAFACTEGAGARMAGIEAGLRSWPGERSGEVPLWVDLAVKAASDEEPRRDPAARTALPPGTALLFAGIPNPFEGAARRPRLLVWIEVAAE